MTDLRLARAVAGDEVAIDAYLARRTETCMIPRSNLRRVGLAWNGERFEGEYMLAWRGDAVVAVAAHYWNGVVVVQCDEALDELVRAAAAATGREVKGFSGPLEQVRAARRALGLDATPAQSEHDEILMALALVQLRVPPALADGTLRGRRAVDADLPILAPWRAAYMVETSNHPPGPETDAIAAAGLAAWIAERHMWVVERDGAIVAMAGFNATLPDAVQVGGVYTPPALRSRGHGRAAVAAALLDARAEGVTRAILFTPFPDALAAYAALGFTEIGRFGVIQL